VSAVGNSHQISDYGGDRQMVGSTDSCFGQMVADTGLFYNLGDTYRWKITFVRIDCEFIETSQTH